MKKGFAVVFPGQGSQHLKMLEEFAIEFPMVHALFNNASQILGFDLWDIIHNGPEDKLNQTAITQPALLVAEYAVWRIWHERDGQTPEMLAGHSLGEYTAWLCADAIDFETAVNLVAKRGQYMQEAVPEGEGRMAAIVGLSDAEIEELCQEAVLDNEILAPANYNSLGQVVISGNKKSILNAIKLAEQKNVKLAKELNVSVPCHCKLMLPASKKLQAILEQATINPPKIQVFNNVDVVSLQQPELIRESLIRQLYMPVLWVKTINVFKSHGITHMVEMGPGRVLTGLNKRIDREITIMPVFDPITLNQALECNSDAITTRTCT